MNRIYDKKMCVVLFTLFAYMVSAQSAFTQKYGTVDDYHRLRFLNVQYIQSWLKSDTATYNKVLWAEDFVQQNSSDGKLIPKKALLPLFGVPRFDKIEYFYADNVRIQFISYDAAMIFAETPTKVKGSSSTSLSQYNDIYIRRNGKWQCVSANISIVTKSEERVPFTSLPEKVELISFHSATDEERQQLLLLDKKLQDAVAKSNIELIRNVIAEDFILLGDDGISLNKSNALEKIKSKRNKDDVNGYEVVNQMIRFVAADIAMVRGAVITSWKDGKKSGTQYNNIYVKRNEVWQCVSMNNTPIRN